MRPLALTAAIALSLAGNSARAELLVNPSGVTLGDRRDPRIGLVMRAPLWRTAEGYLVARDAAFSTDVFNDVEPLRCWNLATDPPTAVGAPLDRPVGPLGANERAYHGHLAVAPDGSSWTVATGSPFDVHVYAASCGADPTLVRALAAADVDVALQGELWDDGRATWPARTSGIIYVPGRSGLLLRLDPSAAPASAAVTVLADGDAWYDALSPATAAADRKADAWRIAGATMTPVAAGQALWVAVEGPAPAGDERLTTLVAVADDGAIRVVRGPDRIAGASALVPWAAVDGAVLTGGRAVLGFAATTPEVLDLAARPGRLPVFGVYPFAGGLDAHESPWPRVADPFVANDDANLGGDFLATADGELVMLGADGYLRELGLDPSVADFDRDRLSAAREAELGTSDLDADQDDDGVNDGAELGYFATDPRSAASAPIRMTRALRMAPSSFREDIVGIQPSDTDVPFAAPVLCHTFLSSEPRQPTLMLGCIDGSGDLVPTPPKVYGWWSFTPEQDGAAPAVEGPDGDPEKPHRYLYYDDFTGPLGQGDRVRLRYDPDTGATVERERVDCDNTDCKELPPLYAVDADTYLSVTTTADGLGTIVRHRFGFEPFAVIDPQRVACPVLASPDDPCAGPRLGRVISTQIAGWDPRHASYLVMLQSATGGALYAVGARSATFVADAFALPLDGQRLVIQAHPGSHAGNGFFAAGTFQTPTQGSFLGAVALDDAFAPVPAAQPAIANPDGLGAAFKDGFLAVRFPQYWVDPRESLVGGDARCAESDDVLLCDWPSSYNYDPKQVPVAERIAYVEVPEGLQPGEVVFAAPGSLVRATLGRQLTDARAPSVAAPWALWRVTELGGVTPWLDEADFADLVADDAVRAELAATRLGPILGMGWDEGSVGASDQGHPHLCLAEPDAGRVWELTLDDGLPMAVALRARGAAVGCGYAQDGTFGWVAADPPALHVGDQSLALDGHHPSGLVAAVEGQWLVLDAVGDALCSDGAHAHDVPRAIMAAAPGLQPEYFTTYLDRDGKMWSSTGLCAGADPDLALFDRELSIWQHAYGRFTVRPVEVPAASLAVRPDGIVLFASRGAAWNLYAEDDVFRLRPSYADTGSHSATGTAILDHAPWRRDVPRLALASSDPQGATAMVTVPGAPPVHPSDDWERFADHATEPVPDEEVGPEAADDAHAEADSAASAETAPVRRGGGCDGCEAAGDGLPTGLVVGLFALVGLRVTRRRAAAR